MKMRGWMVNKTTGHHWRRVLCAAILLSLIQGAMAVVPVMPVVKSEFIYETAPFPSCHASTIVETRAGGLVTAWFGGTAERNPDVCIYVSRLEHDQWTTPMEVGNGGGF